MFELDEMGVCFGTEGECHLRGSALSITGRLVHLPFSPAQACESHARSGEDHRPARDLVPDWAVVRYGKCDAPVKLRQQLCLEVVVEVVSLT